MSRKKESKREMLREYERELIDKIDKFKLVYRVKHTQWRRHIIKKKWNKKLGCVESISVSVPDSRSVETEHGCVQIIGETYVSLYYLNNGLKGRRLDDELPVGIGFSLCSERDQFDRQIGRVKALDRALKSFLNSEAENVK